MWRILWTKPKANKTSQNAQAVFINRPASGEDLVRNQILKWLTKIESILDIQNAELLTRHFKSQTSNLNYKM